MPTALAIHTVASSERARFTPGLRALERGVSYPLGDDRFEIDHGDDPFAFFDRLGSALTVVALAGDEVVGTATAVLRSVPVAAERVEAWYLCDFKVRADQRGSSVARTLVGELVERARRDCPRGYAVSMDPAVGGNRVVSFAGRVMGASVERGPALVFVTFDAGLLDGLRGLLEAHLGPLSARSLAGVKDIVLASTARPMPLVHLQHGPFAEAASTAVHAGDVVMLALREDDPLLAKLLAGGARHAGRASVLHSGLQRADFRFVLSSDV